MVTSIARQSVILKCNMQKAVNRMVRMVDHWDEDDDWDDEEEADL